MGAMLTIALLLAAVQPADTPAEVAAGERMIETRSEADGLTFSFAWPEAVRAVPAAQRWLEARMAAQKAAAVKDARADRAARQAEGYDFAGHDFEESWAVRAMTPRLASLAGSNARFTGGAHGSLAFLGRVWDRRTGRAVAPAALFGRAGLAPLRQRFCNALNAERAERRGEPVTPTADDDFMTGCPRFADVVVVPEDGDGDGRVDTIAFDVAPYTAGPWAEGAYTVEVPLTRADVTRVVKAYRGEFGVRE